MHSRTSDHKVEVQIDYKFHYFRCNSKKHPNGMSGLCLVWMYYDIRKKNWILSDKDKQPYKNHFCLFGALTMYLHGHINLAAHTSQLFTEFISKNVRGVSIDDLPLVEHIHIFIYIFDIQEGKYVGKLAKRIFWKFEKTVKLLRFNNHIIRTSPSCDTFFHKSDHFNKYLIRCKDRMRHIYPSNACTLRETIFENYQSICAPTDELKAFPHIRLNIFKVARWSFFLCKKDPELLIIAFGSNLEILAEKKASYKSEPSFKKLKTLSMIESIVFWQTQR